MPLPSTDCSPESGASSPTRKVSLPPPPSPESELPHPMTRRAIPRTRLRAAVRRAFEFTGSFRWAGGRFRRRPGSYALRQPALDWARRGVAQPGSARPLGGRGPRFESGRPDERERPDFSQLGGRAITRPSRIEACRDRGSSGPWSPGLGRARSPLRRDQPISRIAREGSGEANGGIRHRRGYADRAQLRSQAVEPRPDRNRDGDALVFSPAMPAHTRRSPPPLARLRSPRPCARLS